MDTAARAQSGWPYMGSSRWTSGGLGSCGTNHLYCLGIDHVSPYPVEPTEGRTAFVSVSAFDPDLGIDGADALCNQDAVDHGLSGSYQALLATTSASAASRFDTSGPPWVRLDGIPVSLTASELFAGDPPMAPLLVRPDDSRDRRTVWIGATDPMSVATTENCSDWDDATDASQSRGGSVDAAGSSWFGTGPWDCDQTSFGLYCLET